MIELLSLVVLCALLAVPLSWALPGARGLDLVAAWAALVFVWLSPPSGIWMLGFASLTSPLMALAERHGRRGAFAAVWSALLLAGFAVAQLTSGVVWIGGAFFTLRQLHVIGDWWTGKLAAPRLAAHLRYQLFLPATFIGPVHRIQQFERQVARRRWDKAEFLAGLERVLLGAFMAEAVGYFLVAPLQHFFVAQAQPGGAFLRDWTSSVFDWILLYFSFAGLTGVALGISLMMGLRLEENFNQPWRARNLLDFWTRWHISLTNWSRDYAYRPVMAMTRSPVAGLIAAMLTIGLWHEFSRYYVAWSLWQSIGIMLNRILGPWVARLRVPPVLVRCAAPVAILGWLSLARPVITRVLELIA